MRHPDEGEIHAWLDGALDPANAAGIEAHVAACAACAAAVAEARGLIAGASRILMALDGVPSGVIPAPARPSDVAADDLATRRRQQGAIATQRTTPWYARRPVRIAAGLMLVAGVGGLVVRNRGADTVSIQFETGMPAGATRASDSSPVDLAGALPPLAEIRAELPVATPPASPARAQSRVSTPAANESSPRADGRGGVGGAVASGAATRGVLGDAFAAGRREERAAAELGGVRTAGPPPPSPPAPVAAPPVPTVASGAAGARMQTPLTVAAPQIALDSTSPLLSARSSAKAGSTVAGTGTITGKVVTTDNTPVGAASVFVQAVGVGTTTREDGTFTLPPLPPGRYTIEARRIGYVGARVDGVQLASGDTAHANLALAASNVNLSEVVVTGAAMAMPKAGGACFSLDVNEGGDAAGVPLLPRRVAFRVADAPLDSDQDAAKARADRFAAPERLSQRRALTRSASEPAVPLPWRPVAPDSIEVMWTTDTDVITLRLQIRESSLRGTRVQGTATSSGTPARTATVSGVQRVCGG